MVLVVLVVRRMCDAGIRGWFFDSPPVNATVAIVKPDGMQRRCLPKVRAGVTLGRPHAHMLCVGPYTTVACVC